MHTSTPAVEIWLSVHPLKDSFGFGDGELEMANFGGEGIDEPICCPKVDFTRKNKKAKLFVRNVEQWAMLYCRVYFLEEHQQVLLRTAMKGRFNWILRFAGIAYSPSAALQEGKGDEVLADSAAAPAKKRKRGSSGWVGPSKSRRRKGLLPLNVDYGSFPEGGPTATNTSRLTAPHPDTPKP